MTTIKKYNDFLREWGTDANKPHILASDRMMTVVKPTKEDDDEEEETEDIPILQDLGESVHEDDPYGEENWGADPTFDYMNWKGSLYDFLKQLNNPYIDDCLRRIEGSERRDVEGPDGPLGEILYELDYDNAEAFTKLDERNYKAIKNNIEDLLNELCDDEDEDDYDEGPDPDEWYDRKREEEYDRDNS